MQRGGLRGDVVAVFHIIFVKSWQNVKCNLQEPESSCAEDPLLDDGWQERGPLHSENSYIYCAMRVHDIRSLPTFGGRPTTSKSNFLIDL